MGLFQKAVETYDSFIQQAGHITEGEEPLAPCFHTLTRADLDITVGSDGAFISASAVDKTESKIIIPVTEESARRTSHPCAHPLSDQLKYLASYDEKRHEDYLKQLTDWSNSPYTHPKLAPILRYIQGDTILTDLLRANLIKINEHSLPVKDDLLVRWRVIGLGKDLDGPCWTDRSLFEAFRKYIVHCKMTACPVLCMIEGTLSTPAEKHPKGVVPFHGNAKLISDNDKDNFTFRGRFVTSQQAATVGYEASQKAHNALRWLVANQKVSFGGRTFLCWCPQGMVIPKPHNPLMPQHQQSQSVKPSDYQRLLKEALEGWKNSLHTIHPQAVIAVFDAATSGRLSLTYYNELQAFDFVNRLYQWDRICCWTFQNIGVNSPSLWQIINCAFGTERSAGNAPQLETDDRVLRQQMQRLLACRIEQAHIPSDVVQLLVQRASTPQSYTPKTREKILFTACAVIRKFHYDRTKEEWSMALEPQKKDRSYQYGRLLAVLEKAERDTYRDNEEREPNAIRMQSVFSQRPQRTARTIWEQVKKAYYPRLKPASRAFYEKLLCEILDIISEFPDEQQNRPLSDSYLLGYYLQRNSLYAKRENHTENNKEES